MKRPLLALLAALAVTALVGCGAEDQEPVAAGHIHGLGVDPADGRLYIATHHGLLAAAPGETTPENVGTSGQDIMGFSVVGDGHFIGSGHPGPEQDLPPNLGLIESRDGGATWTEVSLLGEADFHALEASGGRIYGYDGAQGRLMVSRDGGRTWQERTPPAGVFGLAVDPTDAARVVASTEQGLFVSRDEGRTWRALRPDLVGLPAWPHEDRLYLVDPGGQVLVSADGGAQWRPGGAVGGPPVAFAAHGDELHAALADGTVKRSTDGGATWTVRATAPGATG